ncbi:MAG: peptidoglycan DD-metalloendopeptidase family protein [Thiobacillus sp.]|uniref:murein hydrolase activator EnvC family protein n=1 Tax=Thiobacillus sp. TaxID=924 RepID=UPI002894987F|nr:peptidoglycan DD-metalloendopeptidase family protein [Thiobacillus sp.]MDT3707229.1 peptidoglycan DD-metalloendopeptidase family protein [Thiobacillus sp.]
MPGWSRTRHGSIAGGVLLAAALTAAPLVAQAPPAGGAAAPAGELRPGLGLAAGEAPAIAAPAAAEQQALEEIEASITLSRERVEALKGEIDAMHGDRARQSAELIAAAQRVRTAEAEIGRMEERLGQLIVDEMEVRGRLDGAGETISSVLAALQRISRHPPPALIVDPSDALGSARSAILISAIVPQLRVKAEALTADLTQLAAVKAAALEEEALLRANFEILEEEQLRIATLIVARKQSEGRITAEIEAEQAEAEALAAKASSLKQLIDDLTRRAAAVAVAAEATAKANAGGNAPTLDAATIRLALANTERVQPAVPFAQARGYLTLPASGVAVVEYGAADGFGGISRGISLVTRADAQVVAPADGWVLYRGAYLNYGQIVILNTGQDYTLLLAGLASVTVDIGQFVLMGEPLGTMGSQTIGRTVSTSAGVSRPTLYIEMRRDNEPVDPTGWWARPTNPIENG